MCLRHFSSVVSLFFLLPFTPSFAQSTGVPPVASAPFPAQGDCTEKPREDAPSSLCAPAENAAGKIDPISVPIPLAVPAGTPLRISIDQRSHISNTGERVHGRVVNTVYAFDTPVIPAGSVVTGRVTKIDPVSATKRSLAYANGDFSPFHKYEVTFDRVTLPDGKILPIETTVSRGTAEVVHLVSNPNKDEQKDPSATDKAKQQAKTKIQEAKTEAHDSWDQATAPGRLHRLKEYLLAQSPYRHQYIQPGTRFVASLNAPLDFGSVIRTSDQLSSMGGEPATDTLLKARLVVEVSSATATKGTQVSAVLTEPLYSTTHQLLLPVNSRLVGEVTQAKAARKLHHNGELRLIFSRIEQPEEAATALAQVRAQEAEAQSQANSQAMIGTVEGLEVDRSAHMKLDEEGGARTTDSKTRYLSTGLAVLLAAAASHPDAEHGTTDAAGDPGVRTAAGGSGFRLTGALLSLLVKSTPVSAAFGAYGASSSIYTNFLSRGHEVVFPKDTPIEIGFGPPHASKSQQQSLTTGSTDPASTNPE